MRTSPDKGNEEAISHYHEWHIEGIVCGVHGGGVGGRGAGWKFIGK